MFNIIYSSYYLQYNFGQDHPFWPQRAKVFLKKLKQQSKIKYFIIKPKRGEDKDVLLVHSQEYLLEVKNKAENLGMLSIDTPLNPKVVESAFWSVGGSILTAKKALTGHVSVNLLGGLHHAGIDQSSGFCIFNDHSIAIKKLQKLGLIKTALILDLDVHAGQGTQEIFYHDSSVYTISLHQDPVTLYPGTGFPEQTGQGQGKGYNKNIILQPGTQDLEYFLALDEALATINGFKPDLLAVVLGTDTYRKDPLAALQLSDNAFFNIGKRLAQYQKLAVFFAGGYSQETPDLWLNFLKGLNSE
jgi:acetoin utilization protein AcuC